VRVIASASGTGRNSGVAHGGLLRDGKGVVSMARHEAEREDLMREATALRRRGEWRIPGIAKPVTAGFRDGGGCSVYFGQDPCYHFDVSGALRRAYAADKLYRTQGGTLAELVRVRTEHEAVLQRRDLRQQELNGFLARMREHLSRLSAALQSGNAALLRQEPDDCNVGAELTAWLARVLDGQLVLAPPIKARR
jgi:hypothetical protein